MKMASRRRETTNNKDKRILETYETAFDFQFRSTKRNAKPVLDLHSYDTRIDQATPIATTFRHVTTTPSFYDYPTNQKIATTTAFQIRSVTLRLPRHVTTTRQTERLLLLRLSKSVPTAFQIWSVPFQSFKN